MVKSSFHVFTGWGGPQDSSAHQPMLGPRMREAGYFSLLPSFMHLSQALSPRSFISGICGSVANTRDSCLPPSNHQFLVFIRVTGDIALPLTSSLAFLSLPLDSSHLSGSASSAPSSSSSYPPHLQGPPTSALLKLPSFLRSPDRSQPSSWKLEAPVQPGLGSSLSFPSFPESCFLFFKVRFKSLLEAFLLPPVYLLHLLVFAHHHSDCPWHPRTRHLPASPLCMLMSPFSIRAHITRYIICLLVHSFFAPSGTCSTRLGNLVCALASSTSIMGDCHHDYQKPLLSPTERSQG